MHILIEGTFSLEIGNGMCSNYGHILSAVALLSSICSIPSFPPFKYVMFWLVSNLVYMGTLGVVVDIFKQDMKRYGTRARPAKLKLVAALVNQILYSWLCLRDYLFVILRFQSSIA